MILFLIFFLLIILLSLILAYSSMKDFKEKAEDNPSNNSLFLIRNTHLLSPNIFNLLHSLSRGSIISLERLFKGVETALVIFGPKDIISQFSQKLDLVELEDYTNKNFPVSAWEVGLSKNIKPEASHSIFSTFPKLLDKEQVYFQIILQPKRGKDKKFASEIRVVVVIEDPIRRKAVADILQSSKKPLVKIPKPFSSLQIMDFYRQRSIGRTKIRLSGEEIAKLWLLPKN